MALTPDEVFPDETAKWFVDFINTLPLAVFRESVDGRIVYCNNALAELLGFKLFNELINYPITQFYQNREDRSSFVEALMNQGLVLDARIFFRRRDGKSICCTVAARAVLDESGKLAYLDGVIKDVTEKTEEEGERLGHEGRTKGLNDFAAFLSPAGNILEINKAGAELLGFRVEDLVGKPIVEHVVPRFRDLFSTFLSIVAKTGREEGILTIMDKKGEEKDLEFYAFVDDRAGMSDHLHLMARNVTERIKYQKEQLSKEKFLGILEMAGGVAHRLNQPLTVIRNTIMEVMSTLSPEDSLYEKMVRIHLQIERINEIAKKIVNIRKYESMDYVAGTKIVDIDKTS